MNTDNTLAISDAEKAEVFLAHLSKTFQPQEDIHIPQHINTVNNYLDFILSNAYPEKYLMI